MAIVSLALPHFPAVVSLSQWTRNKQPTAVVATITEASEGNAIVFFGRGGVRVGAATVDADGEASIYNLDDGTYYAYEVSTGNVWSIVVSGATATVTRVANTGVAGFAFFG